MPKGVKIKEKKERMSIKPRRNINISPSSREGTEIIPFMRQNIAM